MPAQIPPSTNGGARIALIERRSAPAAVRPQARTGLGTAKVSEQDRAAREDRRQQQPRDDPGAKQRANRGFGDEGVEDHRSRGRDQDTEGAAGHDHPQRVAFGVTEALHLRHGGRTD